MTTKEFHLKYCDLGAFCDFTCHFWKDLVETFPFAECEIIGSEAEAYCKFHLCEPLSPCGNYSCPHCKGADGH